mmetsp:Transcript_85307/g.239961  ORF Transcript_85307/g.239961 Transcript_85307/m.239961 type:complete len:245 (-) Transcript_85307:163-897(-)
MSQPLAVALLAKLHLRLAIVRRGVFRGLRTTAWWLPLLLLLLCLKLLLLLVLRLPATPAGLGSARRRALLGRRHGSAAGLEKIKDLGHELRAEGRHSVSAALQLVVSTIHAQLLHGRHKFAHRLHRSDVVLLAGHDHDRELQHPAQLLEHGIPGEQHRWGEWHEGRPQLGVRCAQMEGASAAHRMPRGSPGAQLRGRSAHRARSAPPHARARHWDSASPSCHTNHGRCSRKEQRRCSPASRPPA